MLITMVNGCFGNKYHVYITTAIILMSNKETKISKSLANAVRERLFTSQLGMC